MKRLILSLFLVSILFSCQLQKKQSPDTAVPTVEKRWETDTLLTTSESAIYDANTNTIFVSCINKQPRVKDGNGFISKVSIDGEITDLHWITGLDAPKGMGIFDHKLYVADIDRVIEIDISSGKITESFVLAEAKMLNDIAIDKDGKIFTTDTDDNKIYTLENGVFNILIDSGLQLPNGLLIEEDRLILASMGSNDVVSFTLNNMSKETIADSIGRGDGLVALSNDHYLVSDWAGELFFIGNHKRTSVLKTAESKINTADIWFIPEKNMLLVPTFNSNTLAAYSLIP
jgi:hypothetical protein